MRVIARAHAHLSTLKGDAPLYKRVEKVSVMRDENSHAREGTQCEQDRLARVRIKVIRWLIQNQDVRSAPECHRHLEALLLPGGELAKAPSPVVANTQRVAQSHGIAVPRGGKVEKRSRGTVTVLLAVIRDQAVRPHAPRRRTQLARGNPSKRRLSAAIVANYAGPASG